MQHYLAIIFTTSLVNNFVLAQFLGLCPFMGVSKRMDSALGMGLATTFVLTITAVLSYCLDHYLLIPFHLEYLRTLTFIVTIATLVGVTELFLAKNAPILHHILGTYLPLITTNCAVLGLALLNSKEGHSLLESLCYGLGASLGFTLVLLIFATIREKLEANTEIPAPFQGIPLALITAGILAMAFMGLAGWIRLS